MLIGIDASRANRALRTGTEWYSYHIIHHLIAADQENDYVLYVDRELSPDFAALIKPYKNARFKKLAWPWPFFWTIGRLSLEMIFKRPDVLFVPAHSLPLVSPKKTVTTIHDIAFARESSLYQKKLVRTDGRNKRKFINVFTKIISRGKYAANSLDYLLWSTQYALNNAKAIIAVSQFTKDEIIGVYSRYYAKKIKVVHNAYDNARYNYVSDDSERQAVLERYGINSPFFLYVGRLEKKKNTAALVEAFALFKEKYPDTKVKLVMIGNAGFGYDEVKYIIEEYNLDQQIIMPGWAEEDDLPAIFSSALAFVFPTLHEGFGIPVLQAMACHAPCIISDLAVLREVAANAAFYFNPREKDDILRAMDLVFSDESLRQSLIERGIKRSSLFSWERAAQETLKVIQEL